MDSNTRDPEREPRGFAGLSSMVSDIDDAIREAERAPRRAQSAPSGRPSAAESGAQSSAKAAPRPERPPPQAKPRKRPATWKFVLGAIGVVYLLLVIAEANPPDSRDTSRPTPQARPVPQPESPGIWIPTTEAGRPTEERPPVGRGHTLNIAQIRYCLAESIRIDGADPLVDTYSQREVNMFNAWVDDYNSRCSNYRYYEGTLPRARRDIEPLRSSLLAEGRSTFLRRVGRSTGAIPDERVRSIQTLLNDRGYNAGPADGLMGPATREAMRRFRRDRGMADDEDLDVLLYVLKYQSGGR